MSSSLAQRAVIALTLGPLALLCVYLGSWFYFIPLTAALLVAAYEYTRMTHNLGWHTSAWLLLPLVFVQLAAGWWLDWNQAGALLLVSLLVVMAYGLWQYEFKKRDQAPSDWMAMAGGLILLGWVASHFYRLRGIEDFAWQWTMLALASTWLADSGAYLVGRFLAGGLLGRHQLSPRLSPNKTVEGYVGGIVIGVSFTILIGYLLGLPLLTAGILGLLISVISPLGDLGISMLKRTAHVKDSGTLFRGHGGALDRIDSLLWSVAIAYYFLTL